MSKQNNQHQKSTAPKSSKQRRTPRLNWDKPNPKLQYDIFKGFGNPIPTTIRGDGGK